MTEQIDNNLVTPADYGISIVSMPCYLTQHILDLIYINFTTSI